MIKVICGEKGTGKTRKLVETANGLVSSNTGDVVFIDGSSQLMYELNHRIRFINLSEFPVNVGSACTLLGFVCGIISGNYDINGIFIDDITKVIDTQSVELNELFDGMEKLYSKFKIVFHVSIEGDPNSMPAFIKKYF